MATFTLPAQARAAGEYIIGPYTVPEGISWFKLAVLVPNTAEYEDPLNAMDVIAEVSHDGGATWRHSASLNGWKGGRWTAPDGSVNPAPGFEMSVHPRLYGKLVRGRVVLGRAMSVGLRVIV